MKLFALSPLSLALAAVCGLGAATAAQAVTITRAGPAAKAPLQVKILALNDFHGQLESPGTFRANAAAPLVPAGGVDYAAGYIAAARAANIYAYWRSNPAFPEHPTSEQFFGEAQFEAYRALGQQIVEQLLDSASPDSMAQWFAHIRQRPDAPTR